MRLFTRAKALPNNVASLCTRFASVRRNGSGCGGTQRIAGTEHDLNFLRVRLEKESGDEALADELAGLQKLIGKRCKRLRRDALELGGRSYAEPSKAFAKRISIFAAKGT